MSDAGRHDRGGDPPASGLPQAPLVEALCAAANAALALDEESASLFQSLDGTRICISVTGLGEATVALRDGRLAPVVAQAGAADAQPAPGGARGPAWTARTAAEERPPEIHISGGAGDFLALAMQLARRLPGAEASEPELPPGLRLEGDISVAQRLMRALSRLRPDWEAPLARAFGDVAGHQLARGLAGAGRGAVSLLRQLGDDVAEYLREEAELVVGQHDLDRFADAVDETRDAAARFEQRLRRFEERHGVEQGRQRDGGANQQPSRGE